MKSNTARENFFSQMPFGNLHAHYLGFIQPHDIENIRHWRNAQIHILRQSHLISNQEQEIYWNNIVQSEMQMSEPRQLLFAYRYKNKLVGYGGFVHIQWKIQQAELSTLLDDSFQEPSPNFIEVSKHFIQLSLDLADRIGIKTLTTECYDFRVEFIQMIESLGFKRLKYEPNTKEVQHLTGLRFMAGSWFHSYAVSPVSREL